MSMYSLFKTYEELEQKGIVIDYGSFQITIARAGGANKKFARLLEAKAKPYKRMIHADMLDSDVGLRILREVYAEAVILNWETKDESGDFVQGLEDPRDPSAIVPYSRENVLRALEALPELFDDLKEQAGKAALFREEILEQDAKN